MLRKYALTVVFLFVVCGAAAQLPDDEYYPYGTGYEQRTPIVLTDSSLFYRAIQTMPDLYGSISAFNLPYIALGRRGQHYSSEAASFSGLGISSRYFGSLRLLGAREERRAGIAALPEAIGGAGGVRTFRFPGALAEPSCHASVSFTDRNYLAGAKLAFARPAGHGWDVAAAVEARTGRDMHVEGVFTNALTAGFRAARHFGEGHTLAFLLIVPPSVRGTRLSSVEEAFRLTGDNLYNPAWGFQDGKVRNSRVRRELVPLAAATYCVRLSPATWLDMAAGAEYGVRKYSALGWYDARTPMPDNYRYLPGYTGDRETELAWRSNDARYTQVCCDELIARNRMAGGHAVYTLEDRAERIRNLGFDALFTTAPDERLTLRYGFSYRHARTRSYKQMRDLLGADHITDIDQYLVDDDTYGNLLQNDLRHPGRTVREGQSVTLTVSLGTQYVTVPDLTNYVQTDAEQQLKALGVSVLVTQAVDTTVASGAVIRTDPAAGTQVAAGSTVILYISRPQVSTTTKVPSLTGMNVNDARTLLVQNHLGLGSQSEEYSDQPEGTVLSQNPAAGATAKLNSRVNVVVSAGAAPAQEPEQPSGDGTSGTTGEGPTGGESTGGSSEPSSSSSSTGGGILDWWSSLLG